MSRTNAPKAQLRQLRLPTMVPGVREVGADAAATNQTIFAAVPAPPDKLELATHATNAVATPDQGRRRFPVEKDFEHLRFQL